MPQTKLNRIKTFISSLALTPTPFFWRMFEFSGRLGENAQREGELKKRGLLSKRMLLLFGDSQIEYWRLSKYFGTMPVISRGVAGQCAYEAVGRFESELLALKPDAAAILIGTNDIADGRSDDEIIGDILSMLEKANEIGVRSFVLSLLPVAEACTIERPLSHLKKINHRLREMCLERGDIFVDFWPEMADKKGYLKKEMTYDGLHPNRAGYLRMAKVLVEVYNKGID